MLKSMGPRQIATCLKAADASPMSGQASYPRWYLHRWHFLPEGYLSRRSVAAYDAAIRRLYWELSERRVQGVVAALVAREQPRAVLDVGCGPGHLLARLANAARGATLAGLDLSPFMLERAERRLRGRVQLVHGAASALPWGDRTFDVATETHLFGHMPGAPAREAAAEVARVLRPGGMLVVVEHPWHPHVEAREGMRLVRRSRHAAGLLEVRAYRKG